MLLYKILGIILTISPISIQNVYLYFPYSFLGITLFLLASLFDSKKRVPIFDILIWFSCLFSIYFKKPLSYHLFTVIFICYQYFYLAILLKKNYQTFFICLGLLINCVAIYQPILTIASLSVLAFLFISSYKTKKTKKFRDISIEIKNTTIPLFTDHTTIEELEHVIPNHKE